MASVPPPSKILLSQGIESLGLSVSEESQETLLVYFAELKKWNKKINLIGPGDDQSILENHFIDSLTLLPLLNAPGNGHLLDIGSGAGFPGLVVQIARPNLQTTLVEPRQKRVSFLNHICRTTKTRNTKVLCQRLAGNDRNFLNSHGPFTYITSRAVCDVADFLTLAAPLCTRGCLVLCMKGPQAEQEIVKWRQSASASLFTLQGKKSFILPFSKAMRNFLVFVKT